MRPTGRVYRAQVNPRDPDPPHPPAAKVENWRSTSVDSQLGHAKCKRPVAQLRSGWTVFAGHRLAKAEFNNANLRRPRMVPCRAFFGSSLFLGRVAAEDLLNNFVDLLVVFFRAGVLVDVSARNTSPHHRTGTRVYEISHKHAHKNILRTAPPTQVPQTASETHAADVTVEDNVVGDPYIWILSGADLRQPFGRQLPVDGSDNALVQGFVLYTMAARPGICFEVREVCLVVVNADFLRRGTRA